MQSQVFMQFCQLLYHACLCFDVNFVNKDVQTNKRNYLCIKKYAPPHHVFELAFFFFWKARKKLVSQDWDIFSETFDIFGYITATHFILKTS